MKETYEMWRLVRFFKKYQYYLLDWDLLAGKKAHHLSYTDQSVAILKQSRNPRTRRSKLAIRFGNYNYEILIKEIPRQRGGTHDVQEAGKVSLVIQLRIGNCISAGFFLEDEQNEDLIYLSLKGKKFASVWGLTKEWVLEDIGLMRSVFGSAVVAIGVVRWDWVIDIFEWVVSIFKG